MLFLFRRASLFFLCLIALCFLPRTVLSQKIVPPKGMVLIPAGPFLMGLDELPPGTPWGQEDAKPKHEVILPAFFIDRYEVRYGDFLKFDENHLIPDRSPDTPVSGVTWMDADNYCRSVGRRLPSEAEWEKAARGTDGRSYPWGNTYDKTKANIGAAPLPVGSFPGDRSPYGVFDLSGNVSEWTDSWYRPYPGSNHQSPDFGIFQKVVRGGSFNSDQHIADRMFAQVTFRNYNRPHIAGSDNGFRCAKSHP